MLMRSDEGGAGVDCDDPVVALACLDPELDAYKECPAACRDNGEEEDNKEDEVVKSGDLAVTAEAATNRKAIINAVSDLDTLTFKTSEEVTINKITLERYGYSKAGDVKAVWLEDENGNVITTSQSKGVNSKDQIALTLDKDYKVVDGSYDVTVVVELKDNVTTWWTIGFKVVDVDSSAKNLDVSNYSPYTYDMVGYDAVTVTLDAKWSDKDYNYAEGDLYEVAKLKIKASSSALLVKGFTLTNDEDLEMEDFLDKITVSVDWTELKWVKHSVDKSELTISFDEYEIAAKENATFVVSMSLADYDEYGSAVRLYVAAPSDVNATEKKTGARVKVTLPTDTSINANWEANDATITYYTDEALTAGNEVVPANDPIDVDVYRAATSEDYWPTYVFNGGKVKYTGTKLGKIDAAAGATDVVIAEWNIEIPEAIVATIKITPTVNPVVAANKVIENMYLVVAGEEFDAEYKAGSFVFDGIDLEKSGKLQIKIDVDSDADKWTKLTFPSISLSDNGVLKYDADNTKVDAAGSISISDVTVTEAKASLENNLDKDVEFVANDTTRKVVFDGTYTAKKADIYLNEFTVVGNALGNDVKSATFYLYVDGEEVADAKVAQGWTTAKDSFSDTLVKAWESAAIKVEVEVETKNYVAWADYLYNLTLNWVDTDGLDVTPQNADMMAFSVVNKGSVTVSTVDTSKSTVLLKKANASVATFTVKPENSNDEDLYLEDLTITITNGDGNLTADDVNVKIDGSTQDGEALAASEVTAYSDAETYKVGDIVSNGGKIYKCITAISAAETFTPAKWTEITPIVYDGLNEELSSAGVKVEVLVKNKSKAKWVVTVKVNEVNGKSSNKEFTKRFESAIVYVASQEDKSGSTVFTLAVEKDDSSTVVSDVRLYVDGASAVAKDDTACTTHGVIAGELLDEVADGDTIEVTAKQEAQQLITCISYVIGDEPTTVIVKPAYNDYFKVGNTYAKVFGY